MDTDSQECAHPLSRQHQPSPWCIFCSMNHPSEASGWQQCWWCRAPAVSRSKHMAYVDVAAQGPCPESDPCAAAAAGPAPPPHIDPSPPHTHTCVPYTWWWHHTYTQYGVPVPSYPKLRPSMSYQDWCALSVLPAVVAASTRRVVVCTRSSTAWLVVIQLGFHGIHALLRTFAAC